MNVQAGGSGGIVPVMLPGFGQVLRRYGMRTGASVAGHGAIVGLGP